MKNLKKIFIVMSSVAIFNLTFVMLANATTYTCDNGDCVTTIIDYGSGYSWDITCSDGSSVSGNVPNAIYNGNCV